MLRRDSKTLDLRAQLNKALHSGRADEALALYELIEKQKPKEPRWSHRKGDLLKRLGRRDEAVAAYEHAIDLYAAQGFFERATATAKVMLAIDPTRGEVLSRLNLQYRRSRKNSETQLAAIQHHQTG